MGLLSKLLGGGSSLGSLQLRIIEKDLDDISGFIVQCKGLIPVYTRTEIGFVTSIVSKDKDGKLVPVLSMIEQCQEELSSAFQHIYEMGEVDGPGGYQDWAGISVVIPDMIHPAYGGEQTLGVVVRLVDMNNMPPIFLGYCDRADCIWTDSVNFKYNFDFKGFKEEEADRDEARALSVKLGMAVAMADGELDDSEGETLNKWIKKIISPYGEDKQASLKNIYNSALKESYKLAESDNLNLTDICKQMNKASEISQKYEALELAHEVMAADGVLDKSETKMIHKIATLLEVDSIELEKIRDKQLVNFKPTSTDDDNGGTGGGIDDVESLLGIDTTWSNKKILAHLGKEFAKWNGRLNTLPEGGERDNAQQMLNLIAKTRKKYD